MITVEQLVAQCQGDVTRLPPLLVHLTGWEGGPRADSRHRLHMSQRTFGLLRELLPTEWVTSHSRDLVEFRIALDVHDIQGSALRTGAVGQDMANVRILTNRDPATGGPKRERRAITAGKVGNAP